MISHGGEQVAYRVVRVLGRGGVGLSSHESRGGSGSRGDVSSEHCWFVYTSKVAELGWLYCCSGVKLVLLLLDDGPRRHAEHPLYTVDLSCHLGTNLAVTGYITTVGKARLWTTKRPLSPSQNRSCPLRHPLTITTVGSPMGSLKHAPIVDPWRVTRRGMLRNRFPAYPMHAICI